MSDRSRSARITLCWALALATFFLLYLPGLPGAFIFDDAPNLGKLRAISDGSLDQLIAFSLQGFSGPSGRPLSLFSFALQHESWPADPAAFKRVNLLLHAVNATLLLWFFSRVQRARGMPPSWIPFAGALIWLLWPIHVSAVLYVVQRMTLLSAGCMFLGLALYTEARLRLLAADASRKAGLLFALSLFVGLLVGTLCKENAALFPLLLIVVETTLLRHLAPPPRSWRITLWLPVIIAATYLLVVKQPWEHYEHRPFNAGERLLTEGRVLWLYMRQILLPSAGSLKFLYDNYPFSTSLLAPASTIVAALAWAAIIVATSFTRKRYPVIAFAVLFFLASHLLESTIIALELVFEHRNYVGSAALAFAAASLIGSSHVIRPQLKATAAILYIVGIGFVTLSLTSLWGRPDVQKRLWFEQNPSSARAQIEYASQLIIAGYTEQGAQVMETAAARVPESIVFPLARMELGCYYPSLRVTTPDAASRAAATGTEDDLSGFSFLDRMTTAFSEGECPSYSADDILVVLRSAQSNARFRKRTVDLVLMEGIIYSALGDVPRARERLQAALALEPRPNILIQAATWEMGNMRLDDAQRYIAMLQALKREAPFKYLAYRSDIELLEARYRSLITTLPHP